MKHYSLKTLLLTGALFGFASASEAQVPIVKKGKSKSAIVLTDHHPKSEIAANILNRFLYEISGCRLQITTDATPRKGDIVVGTSQNPDVKSDGFRLSTQNHILTIEGKDNGTVYGAVTLLEDYLGVDYWGENEYCLKKRKDIVLPEIERTDNPAFTYRQTQNYAMATDTTYKWWNRLEIPQEEFAAGYWVHTFDKLLPSAVYGKEHPEYYAYFNGKRNPGKASQWCLSNPEVFEIVAARIDSIFKANPEQDLICVSQNDGNYTNCTCPECKATDDHEGALSGSVIHFVNKLADRFPDKKFATLAYLYTMNPPKHVKPRHNVVVMLCDIDCNREVSLTENASGREFVEALEGWSAITDNLFVWDYGINFDNMVAPFPNFHILQENIQLFHKNHVTMHFSQIAGSRGGDFSEMRSYLVSKLMWNPYLDLDKQMHHFLEGYYGEAAPYIYRYVKMIEGALMGSNQRLWIYDSPVSHKYGMLKPALMRRYNDLFDAAEEAVKNDSTHLARVQRTRLPLLYSELELARTETEKNYDQLNRQLDYFEQQVKRFGVKTLNERNNSPVDYCHLYRQRYMPAGKKSLALDAEIIYRTEPTGKYAELGKKALTDGLFGGASFQESWIGWEGTDGDFIVDLGSTQKIRQVSTDFLHQIGAWILFPLKVTYSYSTDGEHFTPWSTTEMPEERCGTVLFREVSAEAPQGIDARYIRIEVTGTKECPHWHYGVGHPSWFFIDEVTVK